MSVESIARTGRNFSRGLIAICATAAPFWSRVAHAAWSKAPSARLVAGEQGEKRGAGLLPSDIKLTPFFKLARRSAAIVLASVLALPAHADPWSGRPSMRLVPASSLENPDAVLSATGPYTSPTPLAPDVRVRALARALGPDPDTILEYIQSNVEFEPQYGLNKGGLGAWLDGSGGSLDQTQLFVDIARAAGLQARYAFGKIGLGSEAAAVLRVNDAQQACLLLAASGMPATVNGATTCAGLSGPVSSVTMLHAWAEVQVDGVWYAFDPAMKSHTRSAPIDLWAAAGTSAAQFWNQAGQSIVKSGGQITGLSPASIRASLTAAASNLQSKFDGSQGNDWYAKDPNLLIGGWKIAPSIVAGRVAVPPYSTGNVVRWLGDVPTPLRATLRVQAAGFDHTFDLPSIYSQRLQIERVGQVDQGTGVQTAFVRFSIRRCQNISYNSYSTYSACLNDSSFLGSTEISNAFIPSGNPAPSPFGSNAWITIDHPYPAQNGTYADETIIKPFDLKSEVIIYTGGGGLHRIDTYRRMTESYLMRKYLPSVSICSDPDRWTPGAGECFNRTAGDVEFTENGQGLSGPAGFNFNPQILPWEQGAADIAADKDYIALHWWSNWAAMTAAAEPLSGARVINHHAIGFVHNDHSVDIDTGLALAGQAAQGAPADILPALAALSSSLEGAALQQIYQGGEVWAGGSAFNRAETAAYDVAAAAESAAPTWFAPGQSSPNGWMQDYLNSGFEIIPFGSGGGLAARLDGSEIAWTVNGFKGAVPNPLGGLGEDEKRRAGSTYAFANSVDLLAGGLQFSEPPDLIDGEGAFPLSLIFQRFYRSGGSAARGELGPGWSHSFASGISHRFDYGLYLGTGAPAARAPLLVSVIAALEAGRHRGLQGSLVAGVTSDWLKSAIGEVATVSVGQSSETFYKRLDGRWASNTGSGALLTLSYQANTQSEYFTRTLSDGSIQHFRQLLQYSQNGPTIPSDTHGITDWVFPDGAKVTYTYGSAGGRDLERLLEVSTNRQRRIKFTHTAPPSWDFCATTVVTGTQAVQPNEGTCNELWRTAGQLDSAEIVTTGQKVAFAYVGPCPLTDNLCLRRLATVTATGKATRTYTYQGDSGTGFGNGYASAETDFILLSKVEDAGQAAPVGSFVWEAAGNLLAPRVNAYTDAIGRTTTYRVAGDLYGAMIDPTGAVQSTSFDIKGQPVRQRDPIGRIARTEYDALNRRTRQIAPALNEVRWTYDVRANPLTVTALAKPVTNPPPPIITSTAYVGGVASLPWACTSMATCDKPASETDARGSVTNYIWDETTGLLVQMQQPADLSGARPQVDLGYTSYAVSDGGPLYLLTSKTERVSSGQSMVTSYAYDSANHWTLQSSTLDPTGLNIKTCFRFDTVGNLIQTTDPRAGVCP